MEQSIKKFLEFNGKNIYFKSSNGIWLIAIKPICEALEIDYSRQLRTLKSSKILGQLWSLETIVAADGRLREMVCLPEDFIYGWIFKLQSSSQALEEYQWKCYKVLHNYFHGAATDRTNFLRQKTKLELELELKQDALNKIHESLPEYQDVKELKAKIKEVNDSYKESDREIVSSQLDLWKTETRGIDV